MEFTKIGDYFDKDLSLEEIIQFFYGLNYLEFEIFELFVVHRNLDSENLRQLLMRKDKVAINKTLRKFSQNGLVIRQKNSLEGKPGYHYIYQLPELEDLQNLILERFEKFYQETTEKLKLFSKHYSLKFNPTEILDSD